MMKIDNINPHLPTEKTEINKRQDKELTLLNTCRKIKGLRLYEYDKSSAEITEATFIENETFMIGMEAQSKVFIKPNCLYVQAMNKKNALKQVFKLLN